MNDHETLLRVRDLRTYFQTEDGLVKAVDGVSFRVGRRRTFALVGESGCGKSVSAFSILRLLAMPPAMILSARRLERIASELNAAPADRRQKLLAHYAGLLEAHDGQVRPRQACGSSITLEGRELLDLSETQMRQVRGGQISMIFQEPMSSLNPVYTCGSQIVEAIRLHRRLTAGPARQMAIDLLAQVGIPAPAQRFKEYPHQLSGGMRQRVMIAMALSCNPKLLIADEPTTALDVTIQAQILDLMRRLQEQQGLSILLITHDLAVVAETAHDVGVMYASKVVELSDVQNLFDRPMHPYTHGLFRSLPRLGEKKHRLETIAGSVPNPLHFPAGCKFHTRCELTRRLAAQAGADAVAAGEGNVLRRCAAHEPTLREVAPRHWCACWEAPGYDSAAATDPSAEEKSSPG